jgi:hypothetical protein
LAHFTGEVKSGYRKSYLSLLENDGYTIPEPKTEPIENGLSQRYDTKGKTMGATIGLAWSYSDKGIILFLGVNGYRYEFDSENSQSDINETAVSYSVGLSYFF